MTAKRLLLTSLMVLGAFAASVVVVWRVNQNSRTFYTDADRIRVAAADAPIRRILWQPAEPVPSTAGMRADEYEPRISADGRTLVFVRGRAGANADLYTRERTPEGWAEPEPLTGINTDHDELGPELSPDGKALYFYSDRPGGLGGYDIWVSRRTPAGWGEPANLGPAVNTSANEYGPALSPDGTRLYFSSNRARPGEPALPQAAWPATIREQRARHDYDLYQSDLDSSDPAPATAVIELNTGSDEGAPAISPAGDFLYFASDRPGGPGGFDIYRSRILRGRILAPEPLSAAVNSAENELDPALSMDGFRLYFSTDRALPGAASAQSSTHSIAAERPEAARYSIWVSGSREVFTEIEPARTADMLSQLWLAAWPWLLLLLLIAALAALLYLILRDATMRRRLGQLSLMAKCLLVSMLIHAAILSLLAAWRVGNAIGDALHSSGGTRVSLGSVGSGGIASQVRAAITSIAIESPDVAQPRPAVSPFKIAAPRFALATSPSPLELPAPYPQPTSSESIPPEATPPLSITPPSLTITAAPIRAPDAAPPAAPSAEPRTTTNAPPLDASRAATPATRVAAARVSIAPAAAIVSAPSIQAPELQASGENGPQDVPTLTAALPSTADPSLSTLNARLPESPAPAASSPEPAAASALGGSPPAPLPAPLRATATGSSSLQSGSVSLSPVTAAAPNIEPGPTSLPQERSSTLGPAIPALAEFTPAAPGSAQVPAARVPTLAADPSARLGGSPEPALSAALDRSIAGVAAIGLRAGTPGSAATAAPTVHLDAVTPSDLAIVGRAPSLPGSSESSSASSAPTRPTSTATPLPPRSDFVARLPSVPAPTTQPTESFAQRAPEVRAEVLEKSGGSQETEHAVALALEWFKAHQEADGRWSGRHFDDRCGKCAGEAEIESDASMTGVTLLCFLSAGHTHTAQGPHRDTVRRALAWIVNREDSSGDLRRGETMYSQTIAAVALCEAYAMTRDSWLEGPARRAVTFVARGPETGRRDARADTSVLGWQIMAIKSADRCGFSVPHTAFDAAARWLDQVSGSSGRYAYRPGEAPSAAATAEAMFVQQLLGHTRDEPRMRDSAQFILAMPPAWRQGAPTYHWYYATLALFQQQGEPWRRWNAAVAKELIANQRQDGPAAGSWDPQDQWSRLGGRIYQTAVCTLSLQVYYRYRPVEGPPAP